MPKVEIYTTPTCAYCKMAKEYFKSKGVEYAEHDVSQDAQKRMEMVQKTGQMAVPVIDINGQIVVGFDKSKINELLNLK